MRTKTLVLALAATSLAAAGAYKELEIREWQVPWEQSRPRDPFVDAQGRVWFVGQVGNYVARLDPGTGSSAASSWRMARCRTT